MYTDDDYIGQVEGHTPVLDSAAMSVLPYGLLATPALSCLMIVVVLLHRAVHRKVHQNQQRTRTNRRQNAHPPLDASFDLC